MTTTQQIIDDMDNLRHMLGATEQHKPKSWGFRNHFDARGAGNNNLASMKRLQALGLVAVHPAAPGLFRATGAGCRALGFNAAQTKRALEC